MTDNELRTLMRKWIAQANHPQYGAMPEVRDAIIKCASDLHMAIRKSHLEAAARPPAEFTGLHLVEDE
jgi:hypothetical protein